MKSDLVNHTFTWNFGGDEVVLIGSFNNWQERVPLQKNGHEFMVHKALERGLH
jgi:hypothetical protein